MVFAKRLQFVCVALSICNNDDLNVLYSQSNRCGLRSSIDPLVGVLGFEQIGTAE
jgi:hypothetical protein